MITFTPLSGAARSSRSAPLAYLLQVDDVRILLDCGSPDWNPEGSSLSVMKSEDIQETSFHWEDYCQALREYVLMFYIKFLSLVVDWFA
jgi:cleavage and polyadenylation specificity factor subunit 2